MYLGEDLSNESIKYGISGFISQCTSVQRAAFSIILNKGNIFGESAKTFYQSIPCYFFKIEIGQQEDEK